MKIFIPYSKDRPIKPEVLSSIPSPYDVVKINCTFDKSIIKPQRIIMAEKKFKEIALREEYDFYIYLQSDIVFLRKESLLMMELFLKTHTDFGAVALSRVNIIKGDIIYDNDKKNYIVSGCTMFTRHGLEKVKFEYPDNKKRPSAAAISISLFEAGLKYGYVGRAAVIRHIRG